MITASLGSILCRCHVRKWDIAKSGCIRSKGYAIRSWVFIRQRVSLPTQFTIKESENKSIRRQNARKGLTTSARRRHRVWTILLGLVIRLIYRLARVCIEGGQQKRRNKIKHSINSMIIWYCLWKCQFKSSIDCTWNNVKISTNGWESVVVERNRKHVEKCYRSDSPK